MDGISSFFCILIYAKIYALIYHIIFWLYLYFLDILYFFKYSCTNILHRRSPCTFYLNIPGCDICMANVIASAVQCPPETSTVKWHDDVTKWNNLPRYWPLWGESNGHRWIPLTKASDAELWCLLWSAPEHTVKQTIGTPVIWDAIALILTSL